MTNRDTQPQKKKGAPLTPRRYLRVLLLCAFLPLLLAGLAVFLFDPFYHYHGPWFGLKQVLNEKEYQVVGSLDHFEYDAVLVGSSVVENTDNKDVDNAFGCTSIKAVRSYGGMADLCWLLSRAHETHEIRQVIFNLDPSSLSSEPETTFASTGCPMYLYDRNPFNDVQYLFNRDVLFHRIPVEIAHSFSGYYDEGLSYNWAKEKIFSEDEVLLHYLRTPAVGEMQPEDLWEEQCTGNLAILSAEIEAHPETMYRFYFPPYSMLWWDNSIRTGERDAVLANELRAMEMLLKYKNVEVYNFQAQQEIITDLNNYMDTLHFSPQINAWIISEMEAGNGRVQKGAATETIERIRRLTDTLQDEYLSRIGEAGRFHYGLP